MLVILLGIAAKTVKKGTEYYAIPNVEIPEF